MATRNERQRAASMSGVPSPRDVFCYYCGQVMSEAYQQTHLGQCDLVLEKCANGCGVSIQRRYRALHLKNECSRRVPQQRPREISISPDNVTSEVMKLRSALLEERRLRQIAVEEWRKKYDSVEAWNKKLVGVLAAFRESLSEERQQRQQDVTAWRLELEAVKHTDSSWRGEIHMLRQALAEERQHRERMQLDYSTELARINQASEAWQAELQRRCLEADAFKQNRGNDMEAFSRILEEERQQRDEEFSKIQNTFQEYKQDLEILKNTLVQEQEKRDKESESLRADVVNLPRRCLAEDHLNKELDELRVVLEEFKNKVEKETDECKKDVTGFKDFLSRENAMISGVWVDQVKKIDDLKKDLDDKITECKKSVTLQRLLLKDVEDSLLKREDYLHTTTQKPGRLLWRISDVEKKMADAKENDTTLHSPVFYSDQFGYKLRLEVKLNGLGQWKGRHMIVSLQVLEGEWDPLLPWPFSHKVSFTLRDQVRNPDEANDLAKTLTAGRAKEDPSGLHLFIPHKTMQQHKYIREDCMFIEAIVS